MDSIRTSELPEQEQLAAGDSFLVDTTRGTGRLSKDKLYNGYEELLQLSAIGEEFIITTASGPRKIKASVLVPELVKIFCGSDFDTQVAVHNSIIRHKVLTDNYEYSEILTNLANNDISDIYAGDIIERDTPGISVTKYAAKQKAKYVILEINGLAGYGDTPPTGNHLVMMPLDGLGDAYMNSTNITTDAYQGSYMHKTVMPAVVNALETAFGSSHLVTTRELLTNTVVTTYPSMSGANRQGCSTSASWVDCRARLMTELEVYGCTAWSSSGYDTYSGIAHQFAAFRDPWVMCRRFFWWLSAVYDSASFCIVTGDGYPYSYHASSVIRVRPRFVIR